MERFLSYALVISSIIAVFMIMVVDPQSAALHKKRMKDIRPFLLAQICPPGAPGCPCPEELEMCPGYAAFMCTMSGGVWNGTTCNSVGEGSSSNINPSLNLKAEEGVKNDCEYMITHKQIALPTWYSYFQAVLAGKKVTKPEGKDPYQTTMLGSLINAQGITEKMLKKVHDICLVIPLIYTGKYGHQAWQDGSIEDSLIACRNGALNYIPDPKADQSIVTYSNETGELYLTDIYGVFQKIFNISSNTSILIDPNPIETLVTGETVINPKTGEKTKILSCIESVDAILAKYLPKKEVVEEKLELKAETPAVVAVVTQASAPAEVAVAKPNTILAVITKLKNYLLQNLRAEGIRAVAIVRSTLKGRARSKKAFDAFDLCYKTGEGCAE